MAVQTEPGLIQYRLLLMPQRGSFCVDCWCVFTSCKTQVFGGPKQYRLGASRLDVRMLCVCIQEGRTLVWGGAGVTQRLHPNTFRINFLLRLTLNKVIEMIFKTIRCMYCITLFEKLNLEVWESVFLSYWIGSKSHWGVTVLSFYALF